MPDWIEARIAVTFDGDSTEPPTPVEIELEIPDAAHLFATAVTHAAHDAFPALPQPNCSYANLHVDIAANRATFTLVATRRLPQSLLREALRDACEAEGYRLLAAPELS